MFLSEIIIADRMRPADPGKVSELAESIKSIGLINPLTVNADGSLIAGYHRYKALLSLGWKEAPVNKMDLSQPLAELAEIDENLKRNELTKLELGKFLNMREEILDRMGARAKSGFNGNRFTGVGGATVAPPTMPLPGFEPEEEIDAEEKPKTTAEIASEIGISKRSVQEFKQIDRNLTAETKAAIGRTEIANSTTQLLALARMEPEKQIEVARKIQSAEAADVRQAVSQINRVERIEKLVSISEGNQELSTPIKYPFVLADPPWRYEHVKTDSRAIENHYPTMDLEEIKALPISEITQEDCVLFMWATSPKLAESLEVIAAWGFEYRTCAVWDKEKIGMGYYFRQQHELLLVATKGSVPTPKPSDRISSVIRSPRLDHSKKPDIFYEIIEAMYPELPKIELFCRSPREGWGAWGNQANAA